MDNTNEPAKADPQFRLTKMVKVIDPLTGKPRLLSQEELERLLESGVFIPQGSIEIPDLTPEELQEQ